MTRHPYGPDELDRHDPALDDAAARLEEYAAASGGQPPLDLSARVRAAIDAEPPVAMGWWPTFLAWRHGAPARAMAVAGVVVIAVAGALALGELARNARVDNVGSSPSAAPLPSLSPSEVATPSPSPSPSVTPTPRASPLPTATETPEARTPLPTATDDDGEDVETPEPSGSDNSGPGSGGSGGSGSGDSGDDSSGPGGG